MILYLGLQFNGANRAFNGNTVIPVVSSPHLFLT